jgi:hypothetical protein
MFTLYLASRPAMSPPFSPPEPSPLDDAALSPNG